MSQVALIIAAAGLIGTNLAAMALGFAMLGQRIARLEQRIDRLEQRVDQLDHAMRNLSERFVVFETRLEEHLADHA